MLVVLMAPGSPMTIRQRCCSCFPECWVCSHLAVVVQTMDLQLGYIAESPQAQVSPLMRMVVQVRLEEVQLALAGLVALVKEFLPARNWLLPQR